MMVYNIPVALFRTFPERPLIVRAAAAAQLRAAFGDEVPDGVAFVQLTALTGDLAPLADWGDGLAVDLVMTDPAIELPLLYGCTLLLARHPVRVTIPWLPGLARAVKLAVSLGFPVRLVGPQPSAAAVEEARQALDLFLHNPTVAQPVEPFHGLLGGLLHETPVDLWDLLERDPAQTCVLDARGEVLPDQGPVSVTVFRETLLAAGAECCACPWFASCGGYFKWPRTDFACDGVKRLFADLASAAAELRQGLAAYAAQRDGSGDGA
jgi:hypothetical protein